MFPEAHPIAADATNHAADADAGEAAYGEGWHLADVVAGAGYYDPDPHFVVVVVVVVVAAAVVVVPAVDSLVVRIHLPRL